MYVRAHLSLSSFPFRNHLNNTCEIFTFIEHHVMWYSTLMHQLWNNLCWLFIKWWKKIWTKKKQVSCGRSTWVIELNKQRRDQTAYLLLVDNLWNWLPRWVECKRGIEQPLPTRFFKNFPPLQVYRHSVRIHVIRSDNYWELVVVVGGGGGGGGEEHLLGALHNMQMVDCDRDYGMRFTNGVRKKNKSACCPQSFQLQSLRRSIWNIRELSQAGLNYKFASAAYLRL